MIRFDDIGLDLFILLHLRWNYRANFLFLFIVVTEFHGKRSMEFLAEKKIIIWLIFIVILFHFGKTQEKNVETVKGRTGKAIPIFQVIRFPVKYSMILVTIQIEPLFIIFFAEWWMYGRLKKWNMLYCVSLITDLNSLIAINWNCIEL